MRSFIILCLVAVATAQYNYNSAQPLGGSANLSPAIAPPAVFDDAPAVAAAPEYIKEFYTFGAPEGALDDQTAGQIAASVKKHLHVVFIKAPESKALENAAFQLAKQAGEQKTAIYVLNKTPDVQDLAGKLNSLRTIIAHKPEVHFVKYRTESDAQNAQRTIQAQYDQYPGSSASANGGLAPVLNFASQAPVSAPVVKTPSSAYLPSSVFRTFRY